MKYVLIWFFPYPKIGYRLFRFRMLFSYSRVCLSMFACVCVMWFWCSKSTKFQTVINFLWNFTQSYIVYRLSSTSMALKLETIVTIYLRHRLSECIQYMWQFDVTRIQSAPHHRRHRHTYTHTRARVNTHLLQLLVGWNNRGCVVLEIMFIVSQECAFNLKIHTTLAEVVILF